MQSDATTVKDYLAGLPEERRAALTAVRKVILEHLPKGYVEMIDFGHITYVVPLSVVPKTYNGHPLMYAALASQKNNMAIYLMCAYQSPAMTAQLKEGFRLAGKRLDMGKSCIRFRRLADLPLDAIGRAIAAVPMREFIASVEDVHETHARPSAKKLTKKPAAKKAAKKVARKPAKKTATKRVAVAAKRAR